MLWGGDWPVVNLGVGLPDWIALTRDLLESLSPQSKARSAMAPRGACTASDGSSDWHCREDFR